MRNSIPKLIFSLILIISTSLCYSQKEKKDLQSTADATGFELFAKGDSLYQINVDSTEYYIRLAKEQFKVSENWGYLVYCYSAISNCRYEKGDYPGSYEYAKKGLELADQFLPKMCIERNAVLSNISNYYTERGQYKKAIKILEDIYQSEVKLNDNIGMPLTINLIGYNYLLLGDYEESLKHSLQSLKLWEKTSGFIRISNEAKLFNKIGRCYFETNLIDSAIINQHRSLLKIAQLKSRKGNIQNEIKLQTHLDLAEAYMKKENFKEAFNHILKANFLSKGVPVYNKGRADELLGRIHLMQNNFALAFQHFEKAKQIAREEFQAYKKHPLIAEKNIWIAKTYLKKGDCYRALEFFQKALYELSSDSLNINTNQNPNLTSFSAKNIALQALTGKAKSQYLIFQKEKNNTQLKQANLTYGLTTQLIQELRQDYLAEGSKQVLSKEVLPIFEQAIEVAMVCFQQTQDSFYLQEAFFFSESNKAIILLESINENLAKGYSGIPSKLLLEEEELKIEIAYFEKSIIELKQKSTSNSESKIKDLENKLFEKQKKHTQLIAQFERTYSQYFQLKYSTKLATVEDIQSKILQPKQTLVEFFFGETNIYIVSITRSQLKIQTIKKQAEIVSAILKINQLISNPPSNQKKDFQDFIKFSHFLFEKLLKNSLPEGTEKLIIIPDDLLNYLPFEVLLSQTPKHTIANYSNNNLDYLLNDYEVNYSYSSTLLLNSSPKEEPQFSENFIGLAPSFKTPELSDQRVCSQGKLYTLNCNKEEVERIQNIMGGKIFTEKDATLKNFHLESKHCKVIHLATHACIDDQNPLFNKIHLADDYISNNDLYNLSFDAELAVLSACNTGAGQLAKGEGVMSLSRGFIHAGIPSVVMSLWSVDDCATSDIMVGFYEYLKVGKTKSAALQQAKSDFISNAKKAQQHPYYWAAFVQIGNGEALKFPSSWWQNKNIYYIIGIIFLFFFIIKIHINSYNNDSYQS